MGKIVNVNVARTPGLWRTGRKDMQSYNSDGKPVVNVYLEGDDPRAGIHLGEPLPLVIATCTAECIPKQEAWAIAEAIAAVPLLIAACKAASKYYDALTCRQDKMSTGKLDELFEDWHNKTKAIAHLFRGSAR